MKKHRKTTLHCDKQIQGSKTRVQCAVTGGAGAHGHITADGDGCHHNSRADRHRRVRCGRARRILGFAILGFATLASLFFRLWRLLDQHHWLLRRVITFCQVGGQL